LAETRIGRRLREEREKRRLTLTAVAREAGITKSYLSQVETGKVCNPSYGLVRRVYEALEELTERVDTGSSGVSTGIAYKSPIGPQELEALLARRRPENAARNSTVWLLADTLSDPTIPDRYKTKIERQVAAFLTLTREALEYSRHREREDDRE
jgi:transcriptional regulator with XRE-family HTH domain